MSSIEVRTAARAMVSDLGWPTPFVETIGESPEPETLPDDWTTLGFFGFTDDAIGIGNASIVRETGRIDVSIFSRSGRGDSALLANVAAARAQIAAHPWGEASIFLTSISAPISDDDGAPGNYLTMRIELEYERDHA